MLYNIKNGTTVPLREWIQLALQVGGVVVIIAGLWLATKLSPLESRINALEESLTQKSPFVERFIVVEEQTKEIFKALGRIEANQIRLEEKFDNFDKN